MLVQNAPKTKAELLLFVVASFPDNFVDIGKVDKSYHNYD